MIDRAPFIDDPVLGVPSYYQQLIDILFNTLDHFLFYWRQRTVDS